MKTIKVFFKHTGLYETVVDTKELYDYYTALHEDQTYEDFLEDKDNIAEYAAKYAGCELQPQAVDWEKPELISFYNMDLITDEASFGINCNLCRTKLNENDRDKDGDCLNPTEQDYVSLCEECYLEY